MRSCGRLTPEQVREAYARYLDGERYDQLAKAYQCSTRTLVRSFRELGLEMIGSGGRGKSHQPGRKWQAGDRYTLYIDAIMRD